MERFQCSVEINMPAHVCYETWHHFEQFPHFMSNVKAVEPIGEERWHWVITGPLGSDLEWDAHIDRDDPNRLIAWHTLEGSRVSAQGTIRFEETATNRTKLLCEMQYHAPAGPIGETIARLIVNPNKMVDEELQNFKHLVERTNVPSEKAHVGKTLHPDSFAVHSDTQAGLTPPEFTETDNTGYQGPYGMDHDLSDAIILGKDEDTLEERRSLENLQASETPYLAQEGALHSEDLIDMQDFGTFTREEDVFTESLDIEQEDLESYTEDIDEEIDIGRGPREERMETMESGASGVEPKTEIKRDV
jgi:hypothetical protein